MANLIDILINARWQGGSATQQAKRDLGGIDNASQKSSVSLRGFATQAVAVTAALGTIAVAVKQGYEALQEGAEIDLANQRFERLAGTIGTTASALRMDLTEATRGMMTQAEQVALAGDLMSLGLAKTHEQAVRLTRVASALNMDMNQLVLTLTNQTTMRFDSLGVAVDGFDERLEALEKQGYSTNEAFSEAFLQQAEAQILKVGDAADTAAGKLERLENRAEDAGDALKLRFLQAVDPALTNMLRYFEATDLLADALARGAISQDEYNDTLARLQRLGIDRVQDELAHVEAVNRHIQASRELQRELRNQRDALLEYTEIPVINRDEDLLAESRFFRERFERRVRIGLVPEPELDEGKLTADVQAEIDNAMAAGDFRAAFQLELEAGVTGITSTGAAGAEAQNRAEGIAELMGLGDAALAESAERAARLYYTEVADQATIQARQDRFAEAVVESFDADAYRVMLENKLTGAVPAPEVRPTVDATEVDVLAGKLSLTQAEIAGVTQTVASIDDLPVRTLRDVADEAGDNLADITDGSPYQADVTGNLEEKLGVIQSIESTLNRIPGTYNVRINTTTSGVPAPSAGASGLGQGGPAPSPSLPPQGNPGFAGGGNNINLSPGSIVVSGVSDPNQAAEMVVRKLQDRGVLRQGMLR